MKTNEAKNKMEATLKNQSLESLTEIARRLMVDARDEAHTVLEFTLNELEARLGAAFPAFCETL